MDRRIPSSSKEHSEDRLKHIAGLIKKLTFEEMNTLAKQIADSVDVSDKRLVPYGLLKVADDILGSDQPAATPPLAFR